MRAKLSIGPEDAVTLSRRDAEALGAAQGDEVDVVTLRGAFALVSPSRKEGSWFAGSLAALSFGEVAQLVASTLRSGMLLLSFGSDRERDPRGAPPAQLRRKAISFRDGQVVFASSSDPADRLGPVLWRSGVLPLPDLDRASQLVGAGRPLGQVLVDEGLLTSAQLYEGIVRQVREIVLGCFHEGEGDFVFRAGPHDERNAVKLPERTRDLLLAGMRRGEELEGLQADHVPDLGAPLRRLGAAGPELDFRAARLLALADGRPLRAAMAEAQLSTYDGVHAAAALVRAGLAALEAAPRPPPEPPAPALTPVPVPPPAGGGAFESYRRIFKRLYPPLRQASPDARERLNGYLERLPPRQRELFDGVRLDGQGDLDVARVLVNVSGSGVYVGAAARAAALEALDGFLAFALFEVKNVLPREEAEALLRVVGRMQMGKA
jgi:Domain of unknown function (DUF4388)